MNNRSILPKSSPTFVRATFLFALITTLMPSSIGAQTTANSAAENSNLQSPASNSPTNSAARPTTPRVLKATVQKVELGLEELRDIGLDLKHLRTDCRHLYDEVTLQPVSIYTEPEMIANGVLISIPIGVQPVGPPAPPRQERIDLFMGEIKPIVALLKRNVDDFVAGNSVLDMPDVAKKKLTPEFTQWVSVVNHLAFQFGELESMTKGPPYDNYAIAAASGAIESDIKQLEDIRRTTYKVMREEGKQLR